MAEPPRDRTDQPEYARFEERAIVRLREHGFRITMPRVQVIRALAASNKALSAYQLHATILEAGGRIDVVSVYRILGTLVQLGLAHHIGVVDGFLACHIEHEHEHETEHLVCRSCGSVTETAVPELALRATREQLTGLGFDMDEVKIEVLGRCAPCAAKTR